MILSDVCVRISYDEIEDGPRIDEAIKVLREIKSAFVKAGGFTENEEDDLDNAIDILVRVKEMEAF